MPEVNVDQKQIEKLFFDLDDCITNVQKAIITINNSYRNLGANWKDAKYKELGKIVDSCTKELVKVRDEFSQAFEKMRLLYECILEYESVELTSGNQTNFQTRLGQAASVVLNVGLLGLAGSNVIRAINGENPQPLNNVDGLVTGADSVARWVDRSRFAQRVDQRIEEHRILHQIRHGDMVSDFGEQDNPDHILIINSDD